jgi:GNAT superfamily N-acetyltransferase
VVRRGDAWFALLSGEQNAELNVCGVLPGAGATAVAELVDALGPDLPAVVFRSARADRDSTTALERLGFSTAPQPEALMVCLQPPSPSPGPFRSRRATRQEWPIGLDISAETHEVGRAMLERTLGLADPEAVDLWLAWDGEEPVSAVWLLRGEGAIGVWSMMTPRRHQRRGAGRALLTAALTDTWSSATRFAILVATPAGRRLYESTGFTVADEVTTSFRGMDQALLEAIGQPGPNAGAGPVP